MKKVILSLCFLINHSYTQSLDSQPVPNIPYNNVNNSSKNPIQENLHGEQKDPHNFEDIMECLTNPDSNCNAILFNPEDTGIYAKTHFNLRTEPQKTIAKICGKTPEINAAIELYGNIFSSERKFFGRALYNQEFKKSIKQKERLAKLCLKITRWSRSETLNDENLETYYKNQYIRLKEGTYSGKDEWRHLSKEYKPFLLDIMSVIEKKEKADVFTDFIAYHNINAPEHFNIGAITYMQKDPHNFFDIIECIVNPQSHCNAILFSSDGDFAQSAYNLRCEAKKTIADYINNPENHNNLRNIEKKIIRKSEVYWKKKEAKKISTIHKICQNIAASYDCFCNDTTQEIFYKELTKHGFEKILENTIFKEPAQSDDDYE